MSNDRGRRGDRWRLLKQHVRSTRGPCCRCGQAIDYTLVWPDPWCFTVDHYPHPLSLRPDLAEDPSNLRPAHLRCNQAAGNTAPRPTLGDTSEPW